MSNKDILESIKKCEGFVGAILKIKRSHYEVMALIVRMNKIKDKTR